MQPTRLILNTLIVILFAAASVAQEKIAVTVLTDRPDAIYSVNDPVTFTAVVSQGDKPVASGELTYAVTQDGWSTLEVGKRALSEKPASIVNSLSVPGFLRCTVTYVDAAGKKHHGTAGAGMDPLSIKASMPPPEDFDAFWAEKKAKLAKVPMNPKLSDVSSRVAGVVCADLKLDCLGGAPVSGYYCRPADAQPKSLPAVLWVHGAGVRSSVLRPEMAAQGMLVLDINAHGIPNGKAKTYYTDLAKGDLAGYPHKGREDRETSYFLGMYFRLMRAMDFLTAQPEWDGKTLMVRGSSQGGGQSLVAAGLDERVTALFANVPAMCDHTGVVNGWPRLVPRDAQGKPDANIQQVARYFDAMNFASRTTADALVSVGFIDKTCRPTSVYATYSNLRGKKQMLNKPLMTHAMPPEWNGMVLKMMKEHIAARE